jgi:Peptidase family M28
MVGPAALVVGVFVSCPARAVGQAPLEQPGEFPVPVETYRTHMSVLAADSLGGRGAGYPGDLLAAEYVASVYRTLGLTPLGDEADGGDGFFQPFTLHPRRPVVPFELRTTRNVIGLLEGSDPMLRDQVVVVGAHLDGQGKVGEANMGRRPPTDDDSIYNAANDNASGVVAMLAVAEALAKGEALRRSVVFVAFGAEEHGLVGSLHYVANPPLPWKRHVAMINLEMVGWDAERTVNVRATGTSSAWPAILDAATRASDVPVTTRMPELTNDTDHYGFGVRGVPAVHYGVGGSREHYHASSDEEELIAFDALRERSRHVAETVHLLADAETPPPFTWTHPRDAGITGAPLTAAEFELLGLGATDGAVKVTAVARGLAADAAGIQAGDVILTVGDRTLAREDRGLRVLAEAIGSAPVGQTLTLPLIVRRDADSLSVSLVFPPRIPNRPKR